VTWTGAFAGALTGLVLGPLVAGFVHTAPQPGAWWAPWRPSGRRWSDTSVRDRVAVTAGSGVGAALAGAGSGWTAAWPAFVLVGVAAGPLTVVDLRIHRLPDRIVLPTALLAAVLLAVAAIVQDAPRPLLRALVGAAVVLVALGGLAVAARGAFGLGDAKCAAVLALLLGWRSVEAVVVGLWVGFAVAAVGALVLVAARRAGWRSRIAFGPALLLGALGTSALLAV
jgi:leader peptidase (prepilin peptidase) / N-methyltransferase